MEEIICSFDEVELYLHQLIESSMGWFDKYFRKYDKDQRTSIILYFSVTLIFVLYVVFNREIGLINWAKNGLELRQQKKEIVRYDKEIGVMEKKINMLSTDKDTLEQFARENFLFASPGEDVYLISEED